MKKQNLVKIYYNAMFHQLGHFKIIEKFGNFLKDVSLKNKTNKKKEIEYIFQLTSTTIKPILKILGTYKFKTVGFKTSN